MPRYGRSVLERGTQIDKSTALQALPTSSYEAAVAALRPTWWWKCNETTGSTLVDSGSAGNNLTLHGTTALQQPGPGLPGLLVPSIQFSTASVAGYGESASLSNLPTGGTGRWSIAFWANAAAAALFGASAQAFASFTSAMYANSSQMRFINRNAQVTLGAGSTPNSTWKFYVGTAVWTGSTGTLTGYVNGAQTVQTGESAASDDTTTNWYVGNDGAAGGNALMCEVAIWQGVQLAPNWVSLLYTAATTVSFEPAAYLKQVAVTRANRY